MRELSLFSGAGGGLLGTKLLGWKTIGYVEINEYCQQVLRARIDDGILDPAPIFGDIKTFINDGYAASYQGLVDVITAGFPCQPFSVAGKRKGADDERNMWPATIETIRLVRPRFCLLENVPNLLSYEYFGTILAGLAALGYVGSYCCISAKSQGSPIERKRLYIACTNQIHAEKRLGALENRPETLQGKHPNQCPSFWLAPPSGNPRMVTRMANRMDRVEALGNGQVPAVVRAAWQILNDHSEVQP